MTTSVLGTIIMALDKSNLSPAGTDYSESQKTSAFLDLNMFNQATYYYINGAIDKFPVDELELMRAYIEAMSDDTDLKTQLINILSRIDVTGPATTH